METQRFRNWSNCAQGSVELTLTFLPVHSWAVNMQTLLLPPRVHIKAVRWALLIQNIFLTYFKTKQKGA